MIDPKAFMAMSETDKATYLASLSPQDRIALQAQLAAINPALNNAGSDLATDDTQIVKDPEVQLSGQAPSLTLPITNRAIPKLSFQRKMDYGTFSKLGREDQIAYMNTLSEDERKSFSDEKAKYNINRGLDNLSTVGTVASTVVDAANLSNPAQTEVAPSAIANAATGAIAGAKLGPVGLIGGALFGAITGGIKAGNQREAYDTQEMERQKKKFVGLTVQPTSYETGGVAKTDADPELEFPVQEEEGEVMLFPDGRMVDSMATKKHKQMKGNDVTDHIPDGTMIFSNSKKKLINLSMIKDHVFTITKGHYSEDGNTPGETVLMKDVYGTGKKTPAAIAKKIRDDHPIIEEPKEQIEIETNAENLRRRAQLLLPIMQMQEGTYEKFEFEKPMKFEKGGIARKKRKAKIPKYEEGGVPQPDIDTFLKMPKEQRDAFIASLPTYEERAAYMDQVYQASVKGFAEIGITPPAKTAITPTTTPAIPPVTSTTTPPPVTAGSATTPPVSTGTATTLPKLSDDAFAKVDETLAADRDRVDQQYNELNADNDALYRGHKFRNFGILVNKLAGNAFQNPEVTPETYGTEHVDSMFPKVSESEIQSQLSSIRRGQNRVLQSVNDSGISGSNIGSAVASTQANLIDAESQIRTKSGQFNKNQEGRRFERLKQIIDLNRRGEVAAENATRSNRNSLVANVAGVGADAIKAEGSLQEALATKRQELNRWKQENESRISQAEFNNIVKKEELKLKREWNNKINTELAEIISKFTLTV